MAAKKSAKKIGARKSAAKPATKTAAKPAAKTAAKPATKTAAKPAAKTAAKPAAKTAAKPAAKTAAKPAAKTAAKPAASKPAASKPAASKPAASKPAASKPARDAAAKPAASKPASDAAAKPAAAPSGAEAIFAEYWQKPGDLELLRIYADALEQAGDPRGKFMQLSLAGEAQDDARATMARNLKGKLVGPAAKFLREWEFAPATGLVEKARTELPNLLNGLDEIGRLNPRLILTLTSVKTLKDAQELGAVPPDKLAKIWFIDFGMITGSFGGVQLSDKQLAAMAPAFAELECLQLSCRGTPGKCFSPDGLRALGAHAKKLRYLAIDFYQGELPPPVEYGRAIADTPGFASLAGLELAELRPGDVSGLPGKLNPISASLNFQARDGLAARLATVL